MFDRALGVLLLPLLPPRPPRSPLERWQNELALPKPPELRATLLALSRLPPRLALVLLSRSEIARTPSSSESRPPANGDAAAVAATDADVLLPRAPAERGRRDCR